MLSSINALFRKMCSLSRAADRRRPRGWLPCVEGLEARQAPACFTSFDPAAALLLAQGVTTMSRRFFTFVLLAGFGLATFSASGAYAQPGAGKPGTTPRARAKPADPEAAALFINLLARYAANAPDKSALDKRLEEALKDLPDGRKTAERLVHNFRQVPLAERQAVFGDLADAGAKKLALARYETAFKRAARSPRAMPKLLGAPLDEQAPSARAGVGSKKRTTQEDPKHREFQDVLPKLTAITAKVAPIKPGKQPQFTLRYKGFYCREETDWDGGTNSDEIYITTTVITGTGQVVTRTEKHPNGKSHYGDVDSGEWRSGPVVPCWTGPAQNISLIVVVMERDYGDPNKFKKEIDLAAKAAAAVAVYFGADAAIAAIVADKLSDLLNWLFDTGDDEIAVVGRDFTATGLSALAGQPQVQGSKSKIWRHFETRHVGDGADYRVYFEVSK